MGPALRSRGAAAAMTLRPGGGPWGSWERNAAAAGLAGADGAGGGALTADGARLGGSGPASGTGGMGPFRVVGGSPDEPATQDADAAAGCAASSAALSSITGCAGAGAWTGAALRGLEKRGSQPLVKRRRGLT